MNAYNDWLLKIGVPADTVPPVVLITGIVIIGIVAFAANFVAKRVIIRLVHAFIERSRIDGLKLLQEKKVFTKLSHIAPAIVIQRLTPLLLAGWPTLISAASTAVVVYLIVAGMIVVFSLLDVIQTASERSPATRKIPVKGFVQAIKLIVVLVCLILIVAVIIGKSPLILMSGLGALTAILMLIFKDAILGFVAGIQLSVNNMVQTGDWIEMPKQGADGDVIDVSLTTVKVQNWDKTITTVPSYMLISDSFKNWRGMTESGGRRIKRSLYIDMSTIRFLDKELLERCKQILLLQPYLERVLAEIQAHNSERKLEMNDLLNGRHLTNIGTFRAYCAAYLRQHPKIHQEMTFLVRQLQPTAHGLPLEIYVFTNDVRWAVYEGIQADIFDHLLAIIPHFGLRVFQDPSGRDIAEAGAALAASQRTALDQLALSDDIGLDQRS